MLTFEEIISSTFLIVQEDNYWNEDEELDEKFESNFENGMLDNALEHYPGEF